jgi:hypothetical protein
MRWFFLASFLSSLLLMRSLGMNRAFTDDAAKLFTIAAAVVAVAEIMALFLSRVCG